MEKPSSKAEKLSGDLKVPYSGNERTIADEMFDTIILLAGPRTWNDTRESWLAKAAKQAGISYRSAKALFYKEFADPGSSIVEKVRRAVETYQSEQAGIAANEYQQLRERIAKLEAALSVRDKDDYRQGHAEGQSVGVNNDGLLGQGHSALVGRDQQSKPAEIEDHTHDG